MKTRTRILAVSVAVAVGGALTAGVAAAAGDGTSPDGPDQEQRTEQRTYEVIRAIEQEDLSAIRASMAPDATLTAPITFSGNQQPDAVYTGVEEVLAYFQGNIDAMERIDFVDERVTVAAGGRTSFVEANGSFVAVDGRPYRNVYVFRFDWGSDGRVTEASEYYNPITFCQTFPEQQPPC